VNFLQEVEAERNRQIEIGWHDEHNTAFSWVCYICNYVTRFAMPATFDVNKYNFRTCMVKAAAICYAAWEWHHGDVTDAETLPVKVQP
jgi:hypothetical protein